jgi:hypothetical protein
MCHYSSIYTMEMICFAYFHETMEYGIYWPGGGALDRQQKIFPQQKRIIRIITCLRSRTSCKPLFINLVFTIHTIPDEVLVTEYGNLHI